MGQTTLRHLFGRAASPMCIAFGLVCGVLIAYFTFDPPHVFATRLALAAMLFTSGVMGTAYFERAAMGRKRVPFLIELLRMFFLFWMLRGAVYAVRAFADTPLPEQDWVIVAIYFIDGLVAGTVWMMSLLLVLGIRRNAAAWDVVRFPVWMGLAAGFFYRKLTGR